MRVPLVKVGCDILGTGRQGNLHSGRLVAKQKGSYLSDREFYPRMEGRSMMWSKMFSEIKF